MERRNLCRSFRFNRPRWWLLQEHNLLLSHFHHSPTEMVLNELICRRVGESVHVAVVYG